MANITNNNFLTFEDFKHENGITYWLASDFMRMLGYDDLKTFQRVIERATKTFLALKIDHYENIIPIIDSKPRDYKLTRFACYIIAMNGDTKKPEVANVQTYFATQTRKFELLVEKQENIDRLIIRDDIKTGHTSLSSTVKKAGVVDYAKFTNAGYLGMYNMSNWQLANKRNVDKSKLFETMGRTELAANLFRITQTEERIKSNNITGQINLEQTHKEVGKQIRDLVIQNTKKRPEELPQQKENPSVKKELKQEFREIKKIDKKK